MIFQGFPRCSHGFLGDVGFDLKKDPVLSIETRWNFLESLDAERIVSPLSVAEIFTLENTRPGNKNDTPGI